MAGSIKNVLFIIADQWRGDTLGALGHPCVQTPNLDALAADGVLFKNHFTQGSPCGPARASILTGMYMFNHRQVGNGTPLDARLTNLALEVCRERFAEAALFGYTDTPHDPRRYTPQDAAMDPAAWVCPGFTVKEPFLAAQNYANWKAALRARGYQVPEQRREIYLPAADYLPPPNGERNFPPSRFRAEDSDTAFLADAVLAYLQERGEAPFFIHFCCLRPHPPLVAPAPYHEMYDPADVPPPVRPGSIAEARAQHPLLAASLDQQELREYFHRDVAAEEAGELDERRMRATYYGNCSEVDANIGRMIAQMKASGAYDETLIVFCSDHGEQFGDNWLYGRRGYFDGHFHVPCIIHDPRPEADAARGNLVEAFTEAVDLMPTILEALGLDLPEQCDGASLLPFLHGSTPQGWREAAHWEFDFREYPHRAMEKALGLSSGQCVLGTIRDARYKYVHFAALPPLFFDMEADPHEFRNLAGEAAYQPLVLEYAQRMLSWRMRYGEKTLTSMNQEYGGPMLRMPADS